MGGDGTANEAINLFMRESAANPAILKKKAIGVLRGGSGNGIQDSYEVACAYDGTAQSLQQ